MDANKITNTIQSVNIDKTLHGIQILSLVALLVNTLFIIVGSDLIKYLAFSVLSLYIFIGVSYINQTRKNGYNDSRTIKQISLVILGTMVLIIVITLLFKVVEMLSFKVI